MDNNGGRSRVFLIRTNPSNDVPVLQPRGGTLDAAWPSTPVAHLAFETDGHFTTINCHTFH